MRCLLNCDSSTRKARWRELPARTLNERKTMIYRKEEYLQDKTNDQRFPIKQVDRMIGVDGDEEKFIGRAAITMQTPMGLQQLPIAFEIEADSVQTAFEKFNQFAEPKLEEAKERIQNRIEELRREQQNRIVTPGQAQSGSPGIVDLSDFRNDT